MDEFINALVSNEKNSVIPDEMDLYKPLIGDWDFDYYDNFGGSERHVKGEWIFRRVLEGKAIEDLFICPSRDTKDTNPQADGEYGVAVRMYNVQNKCYDMTYICDAYTRRLEVRKENNKIVCTTLDDPNEKWVFSDITDDIFHWQNVTVLEN